VALDTVANAIGGWDVLIGVFTTLLAGKALASTVMFTRELWGMGRALWTLGATYLPTVISGARALWVVLAANPIGILITLIGALALAIYTNWADIKQFFTDLWNDPLGMLKTYFEVAWSIFKWSPLGLIMQGWGKAMDWLGTKIDWVGSKWKAFKQFLGMETGLEYDPKEYRKELEAKGFNPPPLASAGGSNRTSTTNANITVNAAPGQDPKAIAAEVMRMLNQQQAAHAGGSLRDY
jgi:hypothetical protein